MKQNVKQNIMVGDTIQITIGFTFFCMGVLTKSGNWENPGDVRVIDSGNCKTGYGIGKICKLESYHYDRNLETDAFRDTNVILLKKCWKHRQYDYVNNLWSKKSLWARLKCAVTGKFNWIYEHKHDNRDN